MTIDIHLAKDRDELAAARAAVADALKSCEGFAPQLADKAVEAVMAALFGHFGGGRVYFPGGKGRALPAASSWSSGTPYSWRMAWISGRRFSIRDSICCFHSRSP